MTAQPVRRRKATATILLGTGTNTALAAVQSIVLVPWYLELIGPRVYGAWLATGDVLLWIQLLDFGIPNLLIQRVGAAKARGDDTAIGEYFVASLLILSLMAGFLGVVAFMAAPLLPRIVGLQGEAATQLTTAFRWAAIAAATVIATNTVLGLSRGVQRPGVLAAFSVAATATNIAVTVAALALDYGLLAIAAGLVARAIVIVAGSILFTFMEWRSGLSNNWRVSRSAVVEILKAAPSTTLGSLAYSLNNQFENFLVAVMLRPELVPLVSVTRRAADVARTLLDTVGYSSYGAFAHLVRSASVEHIQRVRDELLSLRFAFACAASVAFMATNQSFVTVWVGQEYFAGVAISILFAWNLLIGGQAFLTNYLYRAAGKVEEGSWLLAAEGTARVAVVATAIHAFGLIGLAAASVVVSAAAWWVNAARFNRQLEPRTTDSTFSLKHKTVTLCALLFGTLLSVYVHVPSWLFVIASAGAAFLIVVGAMTVTDPRLTAMRDRFRSEWLPRAR